MVEVLHVVTWLCFAFVVRQHRGFSGPLSPIEANPRLFHNESHPALAALSTASQAE